jgi:Tfp pilus assembly protein PilN
MDDVNLLPREIFVRQQQMSRLRLWSVGLAMTLLLIPSAWLVLRRQVQVAEQQVVYLERQRGQLTERIAQLNVLREQQRQLQARAEIVNLLLARTPLQQLFYDIALRTDEDLWLTQLQVHKAASAPVTAARTAPPAPNRPARFFTPGRPPAAAPPVATTTAGSGTSLLVHGYTTSNQRLADFMTELTHLPYLTKVNLQVARRGMFASSEAIEFVIGIVL